MERHHVHDLALDLVVKTEQDPSSDQAKDRVVPTKTNVLPGPVLGAALQGAGGATEQSMGYVGRPQANGRRASGQAGKQTRPHLADNDVAWDDSLPTELLHS